MSSQFPDKQIPDLESRKRKAGEVILIPGADFRLITLVDRGENNSPITVPIFGRQDINPNNTLVPSDLDERGIKQLTFGHMESETVEYFSQAVKKLPLLLAVHATFNINPRPDLSTIIDFENIFNEIFVVTGEPWSGKTSGLLSITSLPNTGFIDADDFTLNSFNHLLPLLQEREIKSDNHLAQVIQDLMEEERNSGKPLPDSSNLTLKKILDGLVGEFLSGQPKSQYFIDSPGYNSISCSEHHILQLLRWFTPAVIDIPSSKESNDSNHRVPYKQKLGDDIVQSTFYFHRRQIFGIGLKDRPELSAWGRARVRNAEIQFRTIGLLEKILSMREPSKLKI